MIVMAIAGLHNVPILDSSILSDPRPSTSSGQHGNRDRAISRTSSILQMWRELEYECLATRSHERFGGRVQNETGDALSSAILTSNLHQAQDSGNRLGLEGSTGTENVDVTGGEDSVGSQTEQDDHISLTSEQSQDLGEPGRERVRQIFREWMSTGGNGLTSNGSSMNSSPRAQLLGRTELERIRVVREWIQTACDQRDSFGSNREEQLTEIGSQIERVREGLVLDQGAGPTENSRRDIRRLCGRQALIDLLANNERERQRELQVLLERCPVSSFAFRNRIQSLLRIRLLHNRSVEYNRTNSTAESELGFLRQRNTVSGLREGFLSRMEYSVHDQANDHSSGSSNTNANVLRGNETQPNSSIEVVGNEHEQVNPVNGERSSGPSNHIEDPHCGYEIIAQGDADLIEATLVHDADEVNRQEAVADDVSVASEGDETRIWQVTSLESFQHRDRGQIQIEETYRSYSDYGDEELQLHSSLSYAETVEFSGMNNPEDSNGGHRLIIPEELSGHENVEHSQHEEIHDTIFEQHDHSEYYGPHYMLPHSVDLEDQGSEVAHERDPTTHEYEQVSENEDQQWVGGGLPNEWNNGSQRELDQEQWQVGNSDVQPHDNTTGNESIERSQLEEPWSQEPPESWLTLPSEPGVLSTGRVDLNYHSDDGNTHDIELRELSSRRRVSSLLHSGFRESLDQLIQSYVERQSHARDVSGLQEMLPPPSVVHEQDTVNANQNEDSSDVDGRSDVLHSTPFIPSHRNWEQVFHDIHWSRDVHQSAGTELEMINDLRIEMVRVQQRLDNMQRMLESCMEKQLELQRSIRQEVSAALNRSNNSSEPAEDAISRAGSKWDCVRKGICCVCHESTIDSLLYRCGHMCTCVKCASALVLDQGKCPMCLAPVVEVIRAYTLQ